MTRRGSTIIEVIIVVTLIGMLSVGMLASTAKLRSIASESGLRRQALYALNGEMARLAALYRHSTFADYAQDSSGFASAVGGLASLPAARLVHPGALPATLSKTAFVTGNYAEFTAGTELILSQPTPTQGGNRRNAVLISPSNHLTASLSWTSEVVSANCYLGTPCRRLTVFLEYPYQTDDKTSNALAPSTMPLRTVTLMTVTGRLPEGGA
jgi:hypothetical protein